MALLIQMDNGVAKNKLQIDRPMLRIGRAVENDIYIEDPEVSSEHCIIEMIASNSDQGEYEYYIQDMESTNHTFVNDKKVGRQRLNHNDMIRVGWKYFKFVDEKQKGHDETRKIHKSWIPGVYYTK